MIASKTVVGRKAPRPCDDDATAQRRALDPGEVGGDARHVTRLVPRSLVRLQGADARADVAGLEHDVVVDAQAARR